MESKELHRALRVIFFPSPIPGPEHPDVEAVLNKAVDYIMAWHTAEVERARQEERKVFQKLWSALKLRFGASAGSAIGATVGNDFGESWDFQLDRDAVSNMLGYLYGIRTTQPQKGEDDVKPN